MYMGAVHPRTKKHVGERLAQSAWSLHYNHSEIAWIGPIVSACGLEQSHGASGTATELRVEFNQTLLAHDEIAVRNYSHAERASAMYVHVGPPLPMDAYRNLLYQARVPWWEDSAAWVYVDFKQAGPTSIVLDLTPVLGKNVTGVKYGHPVIYDAASIPGTKPTHGTHLMCCGTRDTSRTPCPPNSCPISSVEGRLPAMPWLARVMPDGSCEGLRPQIITGL
jgi:hypothetical protein